MAYPKEIRDRARRLRRDGASLTEIAEELELGKSTIRYMVRDIKLSAKQREAITVRRPSPTSGQIAGTKAQRRAWGKQGGRAAWENNREGCLTATRANLKQAGLAYRQDELPVKRKLERLFGRTFRKEWIGERAVDFADDDLIIEHSTHARRGIDDMIVRFEDIQDDPRRKIAFVNDKRGVFGAKRRARLAAVVDEIRDIDELRGMV